MKKGIVRLSKELLSLILTANSLKETSDSLEELALNKNFKDHANNIVTDSSLTKLQKKNQLSYLIRSIDHSILYKFFSSVVAKDIFWVFESSQVDYFDRFVQSFQQQTEEVELVELTTAVPLEDKFIRSIIKDLSESFSKQVILKHQIKPSIIGGVKAKVENMVFDFSLRHKFSQFHRQWLKTLRATEKNIGRNTVQ